MGGRWQGKGSEGGTCSSPMATEFAHIITISGQSWKTSAPVMMMPMLQMRKIRPERTHGPCRHSLIECQNHRFFFSATRFASRQSLIAAHLSSRRSRARVLTRDACLLSRANAGCSARYLVGKIELRSSRFSRSLSVDFIDMHACGQAGSV